MKLYSQKQKPLWIFKALQLYFILLLKGFIFTVDLMMKMKFRGSGVGRCIKRAE